MKTSDFVIEMINCLFEACILVFYLYQVMKRQCRFSPRLLVIPTAVIFGVIEGMTIAETPPWIKLLIMFVVMVTISMIMFENKLRSTLFYCLLFIVVILASEIIPMGALTLMNLGTPESLLTSGTGRYIGMACSKLFCFWFSIYVAEYLKPKQCEIPFKNWLLIIFVPLLSLIILNGIFVARELSPRRTIVYLLSVAGIFLLNVFVFDFFDTYSNTIKLRLMEQRLRSEEENYRQNYCFFLTYASF